ncbi:two-component system sensor histidine kinase MprB [Nocardioides ginsengisegetis]|uniref:histidine kinase n=1 Tax=Nocardioides ginsengisegetis TaxID=661491 RepID=A0A7W3J3V9_9ACTN|nr:HAMP domain-containing sensor histidine kinase [Nocardioides ginsengisegetis]MBA8805831.1 two-component system sensor histidine kinase MprB [Nocardioides ginsengisegetis]
MSGPAPFGHAPFGTRTWEERRWHYRRSLASRVILLTTMAVGLAVAFVALGAYVTVRMQMTETLDQSLLDRAHKSAASPTLIRFPSGNEIPVWALVASDLRIALVSSDETVYQPDRMTRFPQLGAQELAVAKGQASSSIRTVSSGGTDYRVVSVPYADGQSLVLAQSLAPQERVLEKLGAVMLLFGLAGVIAAAMAGWGVARNGLRPVRRLTTAVEEIARTEKLDPLPVEGDDEIARLAYAFNQMLVALDASRDRQRRLVVDAGHELRTPLTSLRTNLDLLSQADGDPAMTLPPEARAELLDDVRAQIEELTTLIGDLVELARDEPLTHVVESVDIAEVLDQALARVRRRAPGIAFEVDTDPWWVVGEPAGLERAITNLLDNAAKWSPPHGTVRTRLADGVLTVDDEGPGIAEQDRPHVFERFYRSPESRSMPGSGLGLSIVHQVAERHAGSVEAGVSPAGGARLTLRLPGSREPHTMSAAGPATTA